MLNSAATRCAASWVQFALSGKIFFKGFVLGRVGCFCVSVLYTTSILLAPASWDPFPECICTKSHIYGCIKNFLAESTDHYVVPYGSCTRRYLYKGPKHRNTLSVPYACGNYGQSDK